MRPVSGWTGSQNPNFVASLFKFQFGGALADAVSHPHWLSLIVTAFLARVSDGFAQQLGQVLKLPSKSKFIRHRQVAKVK